MENRNSNLFEATYVIDNCTFYCSIPEGVDVTSIMAILPKWRTEIVNVRSFDQLDQVNLLEIHFFVSAFTIDDFNTWRSEYEELNESTYSIRSSESGTGRYIHYKQRLHCQHNTGCSGIYDNTSLDQRITKNTNCASRMSVKIHASKKSYQGSNKIKGKIKNRSPCEIFLVPDHNHSTTSADMLRFRKVSEATKNKLLRLFDSGCTPSTALKKLQADIPKDQRSLLIDRKHCPDYDYCKYLYAKEHKRKCTTLDNNEYIKNSSLYSIYKEFSPENCKQDTRIDDYINNTCGNSLNLSPAVDVYQDAHLKGYELITKVMDIYTYFVKKSPLEAVESLKKVSNSLSNLKTVSDFESACAAFAKD